MNHELQNIILSKERPSLETWGLEILKAAAHCLEAEVAAIFNVAIGLSRLSNHEIRLLIATLEGIGAAAIYQDAPDLAEMQREIKTLEEALEESSAEGREIAQLRETARQLEQQRQLLLEVNSGLQRMRDDSKAEIARLNEMLGRGEFHVG